MKWLSRSRMAIVGIKPPGGCIREAHLPAGHGAGPVRSPGLPSFHRAAAALVQPLVRPSLQVVLDELSQHVLQMPAAEDPRWSRTDLEGGGVGRQAEDEEVEQGADD